jgi:hypothetical protein
MAGLGPHGFMRHGFHGLVECRHHSPNLARLQDQLASSEGAHNASRWQPQMRLRVHLLKRGCSVMHSHTFNPQRLQLMAQKMLLLNLGCHDHVSVDPGISAVGSAMGI